MLLLRTSLPGWKAIRACCSCAARAVLCLAVLLWICRGSAAEDDVPSADESVPLPTPRLLTHENASLQVSRLSVALELTNAYQPDGVRYLAIQLGFRNAGTDEIVVVSNLSRLLIGNTEYPRAQSSRDLRNSPVLVRGESEQTLEALQSENKITVPAGGEMVKAWMVFAGLPPDRELPPITLKIETSTGPLDLELTRIENEGLALQLERIGPAGCVGIVRLSGDLNAINVPRFAEVITGYAAQGVTRLVVSFHPGSSLGDDLTEEWLTMEHEEENERLRFFPVWPGLIREAVFANLPGHNDESGEYLASNEADAVQKVTRDLMPGLGRATLIREARDGHPMIRRAILFNAGDLIANDDWQWIVGVLNSTDPAFSDSAIREAAIQALRSATSPQVVALLEGFVRHSPPQEAVLALKSLNESQLAEAQQLALRLASDPLIQDRVGLASIIRAVGPSHDERWSPLFRSAFANADPLIREAALEQLLQLGGQRRLETISAAMSDSNEQIRDRAFSAMLAERSPDEQALIEREVMNRANAGRHDDLTLQALQKIRNPATLPLILKWIDEKPSEDLSLVITYAEVGGAGHFGSLIERYSQFSPESQAYLLRLLSATNHPDARRMVREGLLSIDSTVYRVSCALMVEWGDDEAVAALVEAIEKSIPNFVDRAGEMVGGLGLIGSQAARRALVAMENSSHRETHLQGRLGMIILRQRSPLAIWLGAAAEKSNSGEFQSALEILNLAKEIEPDSGQVDNSIGFAQMGVVRGLSGEEKAEMIKQAKANFEKALAQSPFDHNPLTGVAICLANEGQYESAIQMVDTPLLLTRYREESVYYYNVACVYGVSIDQLLKQPDTPARAAQLKLYQTKGMQFLRSAVQLGFGSVRLLEEDPDLNSLRGLPGFKKLATKIMEDGP